METNKQDKYLFTNKETGEIEHVEPERWGWGVLYKPTQAQLDRAEALSKENGRPVEPERDELHQFGLDGTFHQFSEVEQDRIEIFVIYKLNDPSKRIDLVKQEGDEFFAKYRNIKPFYMDGFAKIYMFGVKTKDGNFYNNYILPDDRIVQSSKDNVDLVKFELQRVAK